MPFKWHPVLTWALNAKTLLPMLRCTPQGFQHVAFGNEIVEVVLPVCGLFACFHGHYGSEQFRFCCST
jgi:hypothetical protein